MNAEVTEHLVDHLVDCYIATDLVAAVDGRVEVFRESAELGCALCLNEKKMVLLRRKGSADHLLIRYSDECSGDTDRSDLKRVVYNMMQTKGINISDPSEVVPSIVELIGLSYVSVLVDGSKEGFKEIIVIAMQILLDHNPHIWCVNVSSDDDEKVYDSEGILAEAQFVNYDSLCTEAA
ncbi:hypothetical protein N9235_02075 [Gammaproteobacteria bacterium]|nr:hypothetical protein [Gammaproteobacteria bacterium]